MSAQTLPLEVLNPINAAAENQRRDPSMCVPAMPERNWRNKFGALILDAVLIQEADHGVIVLHDHGCLLCQFTWLGKLCWQVPISQGVRHKSHLVNIAWCDD